VALPDLINVADQRALGEAVDRVMKPYVEEIRSKISEVRKASKQPEEDFNKGAFLYSIKRIEEAVDQITRRKEKGGKDDAPDDAEVISLVAGFRREDKRMQERIVQKLLKNDNLNQEFMKSLITGVSRTFKDMLTVTENPAAAGSSATDKVAEVMEKIDARQSREDSKNSTRDAEDEVVQDDEKKSEEGGFFKKLLDFLTKNDTNDFLMAITKGLAKLAFGIGAIGLLSMVPKQVREYIGDVTATFAMVKKLLTGELLVKVYNLFTKIPIIGTVAKAIGTFFGGVMNLFGKIPFIGPLLKSIPSFLGSMFKMFDNLPIIGAILKKVPVLNWILAAFEILPKMFEKFKTGGIWAALETGLQGIYQFFVGDVLGIVGKLIDYIQNKIFGVELIDFTAMFEKFNGMVGGAIGHLTDSVKALFNLDFKQFSESAMAFGKDLFGILTLGISTLFSSIDFSALASIAKDWVISLMDTILDGIGSAFTGIKSWITGGDDAPKVIEESALPSKVDTKNIVLTNRGLEEYSKKVDREYSGVKANMLSNSVKVDNSRVVSTNNMTIMGAAKVSVAGPLQTSNGRFGGPR
jgi:hypothetical protein